MGHSQFIGAGEDQSCRRVSVNVRAEVALSQSLSDDRSIFCLLTNVMAPGRRHTVSENWWSVNFLAVLLTKKVSTCNESEKVSGSDHGCHKCLPM